MDLFIAIAMLCQVASVDKGGLTSYPYTYTDGRQLSCQQSYLHCVNVKAITLTKEEALNKCIQERK